MIEIIPKKKKFKKAKWFSEVALQRAEKRSKRQGRQEKRTQPNAEFQRINRRDKKGFLVNRAKK